MSEDKKEGFSYESPEKKKKGAVRLLLVELFVLVLAVIGIIGFLQYFKIIDISPLARIVDILPKNIPVMSVKSDNPSYRLKITNKDAVVNFLTGLGYYDERFSQQASEEFVPEGVLVTLTDEEQKGAPVKNSNTQKVTFSGSIAPVNDGDQLEVKVYIAPDVFSEDVDLNEAFHGYFIFLTYKFFNQQSSLEQVSADLSQYNKEAWFQLERL